MFGLGFGEILVIAIIGLFVIGPEKLPSFIRKVSNILYKFRRSWNNVKYEMQDEIDNLIKQEDIKKLKNESKFLKKITDTGSVSLEKLVGKNVKQELAKTVKEIKTIALQSYFKCKKKIQKSSPPKIIKSKKTKIRRKKLKYTNLIDGL